MDEEKNSNDDDDDDDEEEDDDDDDDDTEQNDNDDGGEDLLGEWGAALQAMALRVLSGAGAYGATLDGNAAGAASHEFTRSGALKSLAEMLPLLLGGRLPDGGADHLLVIVVDVHVHFERLTRSAGGL